MQSHVLSTLPSISVQRVKVCLIGSSSNIIFFVLALCSIHCVDLSMLLEKIKIFLKNISLREQLWIYKQVLPHYGFKDREKYNPQKNIASETEFITEISSKVKDKRTSIMISQISLCLVHCVLDTFLKCCNLILVTI